jgi:hypothetical protein
MGVLQGIVQSMRLSDSKDSIVCLSLSYAADFRGFGESLKN